MTPLSSQHECPSDFAITYSRVAVVVTAIFWLLYLTSVIIRQLIERVAGHLAASLKLIARNVIAIANIPSQRASTRPGLNFEYIWSYLSC